MADTTQTVDGLVTKADEFDFTEAPATWAGYTSWDGFGDTLQGGATIDTQLEFLGDAFDLGAVINVVPVVICLTNTSTAHTISFEISDDNVSYSAASAGALTARYIKTKVVVTNTSARPGFTLLQSEFIKDVISNSLFNQDTSTYAGSSASRTIPITKTFSKILLVQGAQSQSETDSTYAVLCTDYSNTAPKLKVVDLDTFGKVDADATIDILVSGLPGITTTASGDIELS
jgi:hypothetical protein